MPYLLLISIFYSTHLKAYEFNFDNHKGFGLWGDGISSIDKNTGYKKSGSVRLQCEWGNEKTLYRKFNNLKPGIYKVQAFIKGQNILSHPDKSTFWHFYDSGQGIKSVFTDKKGTFEWTSVSYTVEVKKSLELWFRLKSSGIAWVDDLSIRRVKSKQKPSILPAVKRFSQLAKKKIKQKSKKFKNPEIKKLFKKNYSIKQGKYLNFNSYDLSQYNFSDYTYLSFNIENPTNDFYEVYIGLKDNKSTNYWSQTNYKTKIKPGLNRIQINLSQYVGERGSVKFYRSINLKKLEKLYFVIDPDKKNRLTKKKFSLSRFRLLPDNYPRVPESVMAIDFSSIKNKPVRDFKHLTTNNIYTRETKLGFIDPAFSSVSDDFYASQLDRSSIGINKGEFRVDLPNGAYNVELIIDKLGYWDVPFWKSRKVLINNKVFINEQRSFNDYWSDLFKFEFIDPKTSDTPSNTYLNQVFKTYKTTINVKNKNIILNFDSQKSGISLNSLLIYPQEKKDQFDLFKEDLDFAKESEVENQTLNLDSIDFNLTHKISFGFIEEDFDLEKAKLTNKRDSSLNLFKMHSDFKVFYFQNGSELQNLKVQDIEGAKIFYLKKQLSSMSMNHEDFRLSSKILKPNKGSYELAPGEKIFFVIKVDSYNYSKPVVLNIPIQYAKVSESLYLKVKLLDLELAPVDLPVGFMGLDILPKLYFDSLKTSSMQHKIRMNALEELTLRGFTTFSGLPSIKEKSYIFEILNKAKEFNIKTIYTYGGEFKVESKEEYDFYLLLKEKFPSINIVYTFSDEAFGYSNKVQEDISKAKKLKKRYPQLLLGGFSHMSKKLDSLNKYFDYGFYSKVQKQLIQKHRKENRVVGLYNLSVYPQVNPEKVFGFDLFQNSTRGLTHYIDWHLGVTQNYPYFEFDGREIDVYMLYPNSDGTVSPSLKYEFASRGLNFYRALLALKRLKENPKTAKNISKRINKLLLKIGKLSNSNDLTSYLKAKSLLYKHFL